MYIFRHLHSVLHNLMQQFPAVLVTGPRQVGKSTLLQHAASEYSYVSFDDPLLLAQAKEEPHLFLMNNPEKVILDEIQYVPELLSLLKLYIDKEKNNGMFLLSGSQAFELMNHVSETLAGRIAILKLSGLSLREIQNTNFDMSFIPNAEYIEKREKDIKEIENIWNVIHKGYMPRLYQQEVDWEMYYASYVATYIERDVRQISNINSSLDFTRFMVAVAARSGELLNYNNIAQDVGVSVDTIKRWIVILQTSGIIYLLQPYANNVNDPSTPY